MRESVERETEGGLGSTGAKERGVDGG